MSDDAIVQLSTDQQLTGPQIATQLGCSVQLVYHRLRRLGINRRQLSSDICPDTTTLTDLYVDEGISLRQIADRYQVSIPTVRRWLNKAGIPPRELGRYPTGDDVAVLYDAGWSAPEVADLFGCSPSTVYRRLKAVDRPRRRAAPSVSRAELVEALRAGLSAPQIAERHGVSVSNIRRALARESLQTVTQAAQQQRAARLMAIQVAAQSAKRP